MAKLFVSLSFLLLLHGCLAREHFRPSFQQQNVCQFQRINALEPIERVQSEAGCVAEYFKENEENVSRKHEGYKFVLNSKAGEKAMANMARWEAVHGSFKFRHLWKQCLKIGASRRNCAYCIETLSGFINSEVQDAFKDRYRNFYRYMISLTI
ncbi:hypothetical protein L1987_32703 [Smallanthus sonchifolius]|uniref:Uncharacterized protein n=1 Tax=Smallanthus sonchifolius TaxID=185202 RepID=A0ACB9HQ78_9ASTR|nr:hypothetical protein L1987_32703 [Smallanthus sonchifolius]